MLARATFAVAVLAVVMLAWVLKRLGAISDDETRILRREGHIMALVEVEQDDLDAVAVSVEGLVAAVNGIPTENLPTGSLDGLRTAVTDVANAINEKLAPSNPVPPVDEAPAT